MPERRVTPILDKSEYYRRRDAGLLGNAGLNFASMEEAMTHSGLVAIRCKTGQGGARFDANIHPWDLLRVVNSWLDEGYKPWDLQFSAMMPDDQLILRGCVCRGIGGLSLDYSNNPGIDWRKAMKTPKHAEGLTALLLIQNALCPSSYDDLMTFLDDYPDHVIEFTAYPMDVGDLRAKRNTVFWEIRLY